MSPRPEISSTTVAGSGTSFITSVSVVSLIKIVFSVPDWRLIVRDSWLVPSTSANPFGPMESNESTVHGLSVTTDLH